MAAQKAKILSILRPNQKAALLKIEELNKEIQKSITPAESKQMQAVERSAQEQMMQIINDKSVPNSAKNGKLMQVRIQGQMAIVTLLNPSQKAKYNEIHSLQQQMQYLPGK